MATDPIDVARVLGGRPNPADMLLELVQMTFEFSDTWSSQASRLYRHLTRVYPTALDDDIAVALRAYRDGLWSLVEEIRSKA